MYPYALTNIEANHEFTTLKMTILCRFLYLFQAFSFVKHDAAEEMGNKTCNGCQCVISEAESADTGR